MNEAGVNSKLGVHTVEDALGLGAQRVTQVMKPLSLDLDEQGAIVRGEREYSIREVIALAGDTGTSEGEEERARSPPTRLRFRRTSNIPCHLQRNTGVTPCVPSSIA